MVGIARLADHLRWDVARSHEEHEGNWGASKYREEAAKARAEVISREIIAAAIEVHRQLGPGLLEVAYRACLSHELKLRGIDHRQELALPLVYKGLRVGTSHRIDLLVEDLVIVELKSVERFEPVHQLQLLTYLRLSGRWMGLLINFNTARLKHGLRRMLNG